MRIVTHTCSNTEIVCALGCGHYLVGVDNHSDYPPEVVGRLPKIGPDLDIQVDRILALKPDLVITSLTVPGHETCLEKLSQTGLELLVTDPPSLSDIAYDIRRIANRLGVVPRGEKLAQEFESSFPLQPHSPEKPPLLLEWWPKPLIVPGAHSWVTEMIERAGGLNPWGREPAKSLTISHDQGKIASPEAVIIAWCGVSEENYRPEVIKRRSGWQETPALKKQRIYSISEAYLGRPGPRLVQGYEKLREIVRDINQGE